MLFFGAGTEPEFAVFTLPHLIPIPLLIAAMFLPTCLPWHLKDRKAACEREKDAVKL